MSPRILFKKMQQYCAHTFICLLPHAKLENNYGHENCALTMFVLLTILLDICQPNLFQHIPVNQFNLLITMAPEFQSSHELVSQYII
jgi:hypothetical protein